jgi:2-hydroxychromene-2-carboxylate isomerase
MQIDFVLDYRSPYAYLASTQIGAFGVDVRYQPVDIVWVMKQVNNQPTPMCPAKSRYAGIDAARWALQYAVPFSPNRALLDAMRQGRIKGDLMSRAALAGQQLGAFAQVNRALFLAVWAGSDDLESAEGRAQFAARHDLPQELWDMAESAEVEAKLVANNEDAVKRGVFGVPTFFVGDDMFFGNDRLGFIKDRLPSVNATRAP